MDDWLLHHLKVHLGDLQEIVMKYLASSSLLTLPTMLPS